MTGLMNSDRGPAIRMPSSAHFFPFDPNPDEIDAVDLAHILGQTRRWNGACKRFYSVAEHSKLVAFAVAPEHRLQALLHDAPEALSGFGDVPTPIKRKMPQVAEIEDKIWKAICDKWGVAYEMHSSVKAADRMILAVEIRDLTDWDDKPHVFAQVSNLRAEGLLPSIAARDFLYDLNAELEIREAG